MRRIRAGTAGWDELAPRLAETVQAYPGIPMRRVRARAGVPRARIRPYLARLQRLGQILIHREGDASHLF